jgi:hypothetical protein
LERWKGLDESQAGNVEAARLLYWREEKRNRAQRAEGHYRWLRYMHSNVFGCTSHLRGNGRAKYVDYLIVDEEGIEL